ncbi:MAG: FtsQ-type POTRA domain-containing protein, partial [Rhodothermales bacterium]
IVLIAALMGFGILTLAGWKWLNGLVCEEIVISGNRHAAREEVLAIARVDTGVLLFGIEAALIEDRVRRHPWVHSVEIVRLPPSTLSIEIEEREPVLLAIGADGIPSVYLDESGFMMPVASGDAYDVPLLQKARLPTSQAQPVQNGPLLELLSTLGDLDPAVQPLISSFEVEPDGTLAMRTIPAAGHTPIYVRLGRRGFADKFARLAGFWEQAVLSRPEMRFDLIDLRFEGQIVTREGPES